MGKFKNWQVIIFTALISTIVSVFGSMIVYSFKSDKEIIKDAASEKYVDSKVNCERTERLVADENLSDRIDNKSDKEDIQAIFEQIAIINTDNKEERLMILDIWKELKRK